MAGHDETPALHEHADEWHHHSSAEGKPQHEHAGVANTSVLFHWLILIMISGITVIVALMMYFGKYYNTIRQERIETIQFYNDNAKPRLLEAEGKLGVGTPAAHFTYHAADTQAHTVQLPIDQAMQTVVKQYKADASKAPESHPAAAHMPEQPKPEQPKK